MRYAAVRQNAHGTLVQDLGDVTAVRVYSPIHAGHYAEFSVNDQGSLCVTYDNGNTSEMLTLGATENER